MNNNEYNAKIETCLIICKTVMNKTIEGYNLEQKLKITNMINEIERCKI